MSLLIHHSNISIILFLNFNRVIRNNKEKKAKDRGQKMDPKSLSMPGASAGGVGAASTRNPGSGNSAVERRNLHNFRVVQRNLVYVIGLPSAQGSEEALRKPEYFGQYGKIGKVVIHKNILSAGHSAASTLSAYVTFVHKDDAKACIQALDGHYIEGHVLRASFGTTKYCNNFIRGLSCTNPDCVYLHEMGSDEDRFTKAEIQAGHTKLHPIPGQNQHLVTGAGGPSGSGRRPTGNPVLPAPVFLADLPPGQINSNVSGNSGSSNGNGSGNGSSANGQGGRDAPGKKLNAPGANGGAPAPSAWPVAGNKVVAGALDKEEENNVAWNTANGYAKEGEGGSRGVPGRVGDYSDETGEKEALSSGKGDEKAQPQQPHQQAISASFNGLGRCAVFTVPVSSLGRNSLWSGILDHGLNTGSTNKLSLLVNPYGQTKLPVSELFDLTLPPVDAVGMSVWPKPASYYAFGAIGGSGSGSGGGGGGSSAAGAKAMRA
jgi:uncharacterized membrane protein YgcG